MPGLELLQRWQQQGRLTPVAILSASDSSLDAQAALAAGDFALALAAFALLAAGYPSVTANVTHVRMIPRLIGSPCTG
mgnify:CR=1 FL=1